MSYSLQNMYYVVKGWEDNWRKTGTPQNENETDELEREVIKAVQAFPAWFLQKAGDWESAEALKVQVNINLKTMVDLLNRLERIPEKSPATINGNGKPNNNVAQMKSALLTAFYWLKRNFAAQVAVDQPLPLRLAGEAAEVLLSELPRIKENLQSSSMEAHWVNTIIGSLSSVMKGGNLTCHQSDYLCGLYADLQKMSSMDSDKKVAKWLISQNLNLPAVVEYAISLHHQSVSDLLSLDGREEETEQWIRLVGDTQQLSAGFYPQHPSCREAFTTAFTAGRHYLDKKRSGLAAVYGSNSSQSLSAKSASPLSVTLSVSQLAVFCRLFTDCGIIQHNNHTELLKSVAGALQTTRTASISAESLRVKYYAPDPAAINIVKEHLHLMLNQVKKY